MNELYEQLLDYYDCELVDDELIIDDLIITEHYEYSLMSDTKFYRIDRNNKTIATLIRSTEELIDELDRLDF